MSFVLKSRGGNVYIDIGKILQSANQKHKITHKSDILTIEFSSNYSAVDITHKSSMNGRLTVVKLISFRLNE